ncbi:MAG: hypothetical protein U0793_20035 [Gemmataceae bacterium]
MKSRYLAWSEVYRAAEEAGIDRPWGEPRSPYRPIGADGVSYGEQVMACLRDLRDSRLTVEQILGIAELIRAVAKAMLAQGPAKQADAAK